MTYQQLFSELIKLDSEQFQMDVTVMINDEYYPIISFDITKENDRLDDNYPILIEIKDDV